MSDQPLVALRLANHTRSYRAQVKRELRAGVLTVGEVLVDPMCGSMKAIDVLMALPRVGRVRASGWLREAGVVTPATRPCGLLTERQRVTLLLVMSERTSRLEEAA